MKNITFLLIGWVSSGLIGLSIGYRLGSFSNEDLKKDFGRTAFRSGYLSGVVATQQAILSGKHPLFLWKKDSTIFELVYKP